MVITSNITMDLALRGVPPTVRAVQDDKYSRNLEISLRNNGTACVTETGTTAVVRYNKPDGTGGEYDKLPDGSAAVAVNGSNLTVALAPQVLTCAGTVILAVSLISGQTELSTFSIKIFVEPNPVRQIRSEDYYNLSGYVPVSGWEAGKFLGTDENGNVVAVNAPTGGGEWPALTGWSAVEAEDSVTINYSTEDGATHTDVLKFDANGYPVSIIADGREIPGSWTAAEAANG